MTGRNRHHNGRHTPPQKKAVDTCDLCGHGIRIRDMSIVKLGRHDGTAEAVVAHQWCMNDFEAAFKKEYPNAPWEYPKPPETGEELKTLLDNLFEGTA